MVQPLFTGVATAIVTPFCDNRLDLDTFARLLSQQTEAGVDAIVVCGTTGEAATRWRWICCRICFTKSMM